MNHPRTAFIVAALILASLALAGDSGAERTALVHFEPGDRSEAGKWVTIDDSVLLGSSRSGWSIAPDGCGVFSGRLGRSDEPWASVRRIPAAPRDLAGATGIQLRVLGDGRTYGFDLRHDEKRNGIYYEAPFDTVAGEWRDIRLPFEAFVPLHMGKPRPQAAPLRLDHVLSCGFVIANRQHGDFTLRIASIESYTENGPGDPARPTATRPAPSPPPAAP